MLVVSEALGLLQKRVVHVVLQLITAGTAGKKKLLEWKAVLGETSPASRLCYPLCPRDLGSPIIRACLLGSSLCPSQAQCEGESGDVELILLGTRPIIIGS